jgi:deoxyribose-phosphate aldolase
VVLPWQALLAGQSTEVAEFLSEVRFASRPLTLKVIIESGELATAERIAEATRLALAAGADFVKTSTGKTKVGATPAAAATMLKEIAASGLSAAGFKASGGVRSVLDAAGYIAQAEAALGAGALNPQRLRFGASGLLTDIEAVLSGAESVATTSAY